MYLDQVVTYMYERLPVFSTCLKTKSRQIKDRLVRSLSYLAASVVELVLLPLWVATTVLSSTNRMLNALLMRGEGLINGLLTIGKR